MYNCNIKDVLIGDNLKFDGNSLVARVAAGDESAFAELCTLYDPLIQSMARKYAQMSGVADEKQIIEDFSQEATLALFRAAKSYETRGGEVSFGLYSKICIRNALVSELRRMSRKKKAERAESNRVRMNADSTGSYDSADVAGILEGDLLSDFEKEVFNMYLGGVKIRDMAKKLGRSSKSVSNAVYRIKAKVRMFLTGNNN